MHAQVATTNAPPTHVLEHAEEDPRPVVCDELDGGARIAEAAHGEEALAPRLVHEDHVAAVLEVAGVA